MEKPLWERFSFFKVMIGDFQGSLRVPPGFYKHLHGDLHLKLELRIRGGRRWTVMLRKEGKNLFFGAGWECFVADLAIKLGEFLIFLYDGNIGFDVKVYSITGCEREDPAVFVKAEEEEAREIRAEDPAKPDFCSRIIGSLKRRRMYKKCIVEASQAEKSLREEASFAHVCLNSKKHTPIIPKHVLEENDATDIRKTILNDPSGRSWSVKLSQWKDGRIVLSHGWSEFWKANHIQQGDMCIFELSGGIHTMDVQILRVKKRINN